MAGQRTWITARWMALTATVLGATIAGLGAVTWLAHHRSHEPIVDRAKNVVLFVANGMGDSDISAARSYLVGADGLLWMETLSLSREYASSALPGPTPLAGDDINDDDDTSVGMLELAQRAGFKTRKISSRTVNATDHVVGLFGPGSVTPERSGGHAMSESSSGVPTAGSCGESQGPANEPSLATMTAKAIGLLMGEQHQQNRPGFFLQVDGVSARRRDRADTLCQRIGEVIAFNRAIGVALNFADREPDTLVLVTATHSHDGTSVEASNHHPETQAGSTFRIAAQGPGDARVVGAASLDDAFHAIARTLSFE